jgi:hypothetical protein
VFRSELDFQAHKKQKHAKTKSDLRNYSKINIEFNTTSSSARDKHKRSQGGNGGGGGGRFSNNNNNNNNDFSDDEEFNSSRANNRNNYQNNNNNNRNNNHKKAQSAENDQYERDEPDRRRQKHDILRQQYEQFESSRGQEAAAHAAVASALSNEPALKQSELKSENPETATTSQQAASAIVSQTPQISAQATNPTTWRDLMGSGSLPSINKEAEFPSLAALGASIVSSTTTATYSSSTAPKSSGSAFSNFKFGGKSSQTKSSVWEKSGDSGNKGSQPQGKKEPQGKKAPAEAPLLPSPSATPPKPSTLATSKTSTESEFEKSSFLTSKKDNAKKEAASSGGEKKLSNNESKLAAENIPTTSSKNRDTFPPPPPPGFALPPGFASPPGFMPTTTPAPPGFGLPPGFQNLQAKTKPTAASSLPTHSTSTQLLSAPAATSSYIKPAKFDDRNEELITKLFLLFGNFSDADFEHFKSISGEFRNNSMSASDYLINSQKLLEISEGNANSINRKFIMMENRNLKLKFLELVEEMIVLLPDVKKQRDLFEAHKTSLSKIMEVNQEAAGGSNSAWNEKPSKPGATSTATLPVSKLVNCKFCDQYFLNSEINSHSSNSHSKQVNSYLEPFQNARVVEDFPSLSSNTQSQNTASQSLNFSTTASSSIPSSSSTIKQRHQPVMIPENKRVEPEKQAEEFPALSSNTLNLEDRFSAMPSATIFNMPSSHLSVLNKKKHRLQK